MHSLSLTNYRSKQAAKNDLVPNKAFSKTVAIKFKLIGYTNREIGFEALIKVAFFLSKNSFDMKTLCLIVISVISLSFCPSTEKSSKNSSLGYYIFVEDFTNRSFNKYIVESRDSVNTIFEKYFFSELELGDIQNPIYISTVNQSFYIARVHVFENENGKKTFKHLKYPKANKREKLKPVTL